MKKDNIQIKNKINFKDIANAVEMTVNGVFVDDKFLGEYGYLSYAPYLYERTLFTALVKNFVSGLSFKKGENIYHSIINDKEVTALKDTLMSLKETKLVEKYVAQKLEFKKQEVLNINTAIYQNLLNKNDSIETKLKEILDKESQRLDVETKAIKSTELLAREQTKQIEYANKVNEFLSPEEYAQITKKMSDSNFDPYQIAEIVTKKYLDSNTYKENLVNLSTYKKSVQKRSDH